MVASFQNVVVLSSMELAAKYVRGTPLSSLEPAVDEPSAVVPAGQVGGAVGCTRVSVATPSPSAPCGFETPAVDDSTRTGFTSREVGATTYFAQDGVAVDAPADSGTDMTVTVATATITTKRDLILRTDCQSSWGNGEAAGATKGATSILVRRWRVDLDSLL